VEFCRARLLETLAGTERNSYVAPVCAEVPRSEWVRIFWELEGLFALFQCLVEGVAQARREEALGRSGRLSQRLESAGRCVRWLSGVLRELPEPMPREMFLSVVDPDFRAGVQDDIILVLDMMHHADFLPRLSSAVRKLQDFSQTVFFSLVKSHISYQELLTSPQGPGAPPQFAPIFAPASRELALAVSIYCQELSAPLAIPELLAQGRVDVSAVQTCESPGLGEARSLQVLVTLSGVWNSFCSLEALTGLPAQEHLLDCAERIQEFLRAAFELAVDRKRFSTSSGFLTLRSLTALRDFLRERHERDLVAMGTARQTSVKRLLLMLQAVEMDVSVFTERLKHFFVERFITTELGSLHAQSWEGAIGPDALLSPGLQQWHLSLMTVLQETSAIFAPDLVQLLVGHVLVETLHLLADYYGSLVPNPQWRARYVADVAYVAATTCKFLGTRLRRTLSQSSNHTLETAEVGLPFSLGTSASSDAEYTLASLAARAGLLAGDLGVVLGGLEPHAAREEEGVGGGAQTFLSVTTRLPYCFPYTPAAPSPANGHGLRWDVSEWWASCAELFDKNAREVLWGHIVGVAEGASPLEAAEAARARIEAAGSRRQCCPQEKAESQALRQALERMDA